MSKILLYTFFSPWRKSYKLLKQLNNIDTYILGPKAKRSTLLIKKITDGNYDFVLGIADFRKGAKRARIETKFINYYGKKKIIEDASDYYISNWILKPSEQVYLSATTTNGPCNKSGYLILKAIQDNCLNTKYSFIHIPKDWHLEKSSHFVISLFQTNSK